MNLVRNNENSEISFPTLAVYKEKYTKLLNNYLREYEDNNEKTFVELQIERWKNFGNEFLNKEGHTFNKYQIEKLRASRTLITEYLENKLQNLNSKKIESDPKEKLNINDTEIEKLKFDILLNFANGKIYELHKEGISHPKKAKAIFMDDVNIKKSIQYIKCTYTNNKKDFYNSNKNLYNNSLLIDKVMKYCNKNNVEICNDFFLNKTKTTQKD